MMIFVESNDISIFNWCLEKPLLKHYIISLSMKAALQMLLVLLLVILMLILPTVSAQEDEENGEEEDTGDNGCIVATFCVVMLFLLYLAYYATKKKSDTSSGEARGRPRYHPRGSTYRYPGTYSPYPPLPTKSYPSKREPEKKDVKCDLCNSKNLRFFEEGYVKCNDCRHIFYIGEGYNRRRGR
jgi:hypothetical protein